jgi:hypothetical protein
VNSTFIIDRPKYAPYCINRPILSIMIKIFQSVATSMSSKTSQINPTTSHPHRGQPKPAMMSQFGIIVPIYSSKDDSMDIEDVNEVDIQSNVESLSVTVLFKQRATPPISRNSLQKSIPKYSNPFDTILLFHLPRFDLQDDIPRSSLNPQKSPNHRNNHRFHSISLQCSSPHYPSQRLDAS